MIYLNNAATSFPKPTTVTEAVTKYLKTTPFHSARVGFELQSKDPIRSCRKKLATLFKVENPEDIIFTSGSTESLNLAILGLNLFGGHVITTAIEHNSVLRPLKTLEREGKIALSIVDCDSTGYVPPNSIAENIRDNTKAIVVNHCSNVTGETIDLKTISAIAHSKNICFIVDASQSAGCIPINVTEDDIDMLAFTGHKSLYGMPGIGGLYIKKGIILNPLKVGGTGIRSELLYQPEDRPIYYEAGTQNLPGIVSLEAGVDFILEEGIDHLRDRKCEITRAMLEEIKKIPDVIIYGRDEHKSPIFSFNIKGLDPSEVGYVFEESFGIIIRSGLHCAPLIHRALGSYPKGSIRVSPSCFNTFQDAEYFVEAVKKIKVLL